MYFVLIFIGYAWSYSASVDMLNNSDSCINGEDKDQNKNEKLNLKILKEIINFLIFSKKNLNFENQNINDKKNNDMYLTLLEIFNGDYFFSDSLPLSPPHSQPSLPLSIPTLPLSIETSSIAKLVYTENYLWSILNSNYPLDHVICPSKADTAQLSRHYRYLLTYLYIYGYIFTYIYSCIQTYMYMQI
jgi:hypothetical protein